MSGDTLAIGISHPVVGSRELSVQSDQSIVLDIGGYTGEHQVNGNLTGHTKLKAKGWGLEGLQIEINMTNGDLEYIQSLSNSPVNAIITWEHIDGYIYKGTGSPEGDIKMDSNTGYLPLAFMGPGKMEKIA